MKRMKRLFRRRFFGRKWVVPVAALLLSLSVGSIAFATTGSASGSSAAATTTSSTTVSNSATTTPATTAAAGTGLVAPATATGSGGTLASDQLAAEQAKENAILDLIREKMTSADQATFDQLRATATEEQTTLQQAQAELNDTTTKINALVDKYLGVSTNADSGSSSSGASGSTGTNSSSGAASTDSTSLGTSQ